MEKTTTATESAASTSGATDSAEGSTSSRGKGERPVEINPADYRVIVYRADRKGIVCQARAWWGLRPGGLDPYVKFRLVLGGVEYRIAMMPNRMSGMPTAAVIKREILRQATIRAKEEGLLEFSAEDLDG